MGSCKSKGSFLIGPRPQRIWGATK